jgi:hypothetical protein
LATTQSTVAEQEIEEDENAVEPVRPEGRDCCVHVIPPSSDNHTAPDPDVVSPTTQQSEAPTHDELAAVAMDGGVPRVGQVDGRQGPKAVTAGDDPTSSKSKQ